MILIPAAATDDIAPLLSGLGADTWLAASMLYTGEDRRRLRDLRRVLELAPTHAEAARELAALEPPKAPARSGLLGWLFKR